MMLHSHSGILGSNKNKLLLYSMSCMFPKHIKREKARYKLHDFREKTAV